MTERFHLRRDLRSEPQLFGGEPCFVIKDPVSLAYFRLSPRQYQVLQLADGRTAPEICDAVRRQTGGDDLSLAAVDRTLQRFIGAGLVRH